MNPIESVNNPSLYFNAAQQAAAEAKRKEKTAQTARPAFSKILSQDADEKKFILEAEGLPPEIAGLSQEEAIIFLKDAVDSAGDAFAERMTADSFSKYRTAIKQFMNFVVKQNFDVIKHPRAGFNRKGKKRDPAVQVQLINQKLDTLASDLLYNHMDKLKILAKIGEINGLLVYMWAV